MSRGWYPHRRRHVQPQARHRHLEGRYRVHAGLYQVRDADGLLHTIRRAPGGGWWVRQCGPAHARYVTLGAAFDSIRLQS